MSRIHPHLETEKFRVYFSVIQKEELKKVSIYLRYHVKFSNLSNQEESLENCDILVILFGNIPLSLPPRPRYTSLSLSLSIFTFTELLK